MLANQTHSIKKIVIASSRSIYGEGKYNSEDGIVYPKHRTSDYMDNGDFEVKYPGCVQRLTLLPTDEESKIHPSSVYGITKQNQEQLIMTVCPTLGIAPVAFRYQNVYGPGQSLKNPYTGILSIFSTQIKNGNGINIFEDGKETRDFVFIDDVVNATILGIEKDEANGEIFNVGAGVPIDVITVANSLIDSYGINVPVNITGNYRLGDIRHNYADLKKISTMLGFKPKVSFKEGIQRFAQWVNTQDVEQDNYAKSIEEMKARGLYK
jgi:dTDP-L-rhamnose 4-epimerase